MDDSPFLYDVCMMVDIDGQLRAKWLHTDKIKDSNDILGFCDVVMAWDMQDRLYPESKEIHYPDAWMKIDSLYKRTDIQGINYWKLDFDVENSRLRDKCPRTFLKSVIKKYSQLDYSIKAAHELEWFVFDKHSHQPIGRDADGYSLLKCHEYQYYIKQIISECNKMGCTIEGIHPETGSGSWESTLIPTNALLCADNSILFKHWVKKISLENNWIASFMPKWNLDKPGAGGHIHLSIWDKAYQNNLFSDKSLLESFVAGVLFYMPESLLVYAPNINSYQRLVKGSWAPTTQSWGYENRTTALRYIKGHDGKNPHIELRVPGADVNPYLALGLFLSAGLEGIQQKLKPTEALQISAYNSAEPLLSNNLEKSIECYSKSEWLPSVMGKDLFEHYLNTRVIEWERTRSLSQEQLFNRYFERL